MEAAERWAGPWVGVGALGGGGALATFNRSVGPFENKRADVTFLKSVVMRADEARAAGPRCDPASSGSARGRVGAAAADPSATGAHQRAKLAGEALAAAPGATLVDAIVMASAASRGDIVYSSDVDDLERLRRVFPGVRILGA